MKKTQKQFNITSVSREDLQSIGFNTKTLTDKNMRHIADLLEESYLQGNANFWSDLETIAIDVYKLTQHEM